MKSRLFAVLTLAAGLALCAMPSLAQSDGAAPAPAATSTPIPIPSPVPAPDDPKIHKLAVRQFLAWQQGAVDRTLYSDAVLTELSDADLGNLTQPLARLGGLQSVAFAGISHAKPGNLYVYRMTCEHGTIDMDFALAPDGRIAVIYFQ